MHISDEQRAAYVADNPYPFLTIAHQRAAIPGEIVKADPAFRYEMAGQMMANCLDKAREAGITDYRTAWREEVSGEAVLIEVEMFTFLPRTLDEALAHPAQGMRELGMQLAARLPIPSTAAG